MEGGEGEGDEAGLLMVNSLLCLYVERVKADWCSGEGERGMRLLLLSASCSSFLACAHRICVHI